VAHISKRVKTCPLCDALERFATIDDSEADGLVFGSDMSVWCVAHMRAWIATRGTRARGRERLREILTEVTK
jgi:hypothetical protein